MSLATPGAAGTQRTDALLSWGEATRRALPWRDTRDPWAVLVSELMLQQTQASRVAPRFAGFLTRFPTPAVCAAAPAAEVVRWWAGMGYNRRALHLHRAATIVVECHGGAVPHDLAALLALPGVGPYTARAVLAFAFEHDHGVVDTNAARVLARTAGSRLSARQAQVLADRAVPPGRAWAWNQAMLDLGATICVRRAPRCQRCPVVSWCGWAVAGRPEPDPARGSAGVGGGQAPFVGSDREGRGRLVAALRRAPVGTADLAEVMGWPTDEARARRVATGVVADGLAVDHGRFLALPD